MQRYENKANIYIHICFIQDACLMQKPFLPQKTCIIAKYFISLHILMNEK